MCRPIKPSRWRSSTALAAGLLVWSGFAVTGMAHSDSVNRARRRESNSSGLQSFATRCKAPGVLVCEGFDSPGKFIAARWPSSGLYPAGDGAIHGSIDKEVRTSGMGSLRFEIPPHSGANASGYWKQAFGRSFGENGTFFVQFRQRFSEEMLKTDWGDTTWKQAIFHNAAATCGEVELTTVQYYHNGFPIMYTDCGARALYTSGGNPPMKLEQGDYNCWYGKYNKKDCFLYPANQWVTFYFRVSIGRWEKPDSTIDAWVALDGEHYKQWIQMPGFLLKNSHPGQDYDTVTLLPYMTNKDAGAEHPVAYTWYDELIVSTRPIAPPVASSSGGSE